MKRKRLKFVALIVAASLLPGSGAVMAADPVPAITTVITGDNVSVTVDQVAGEMPGEVNAGVNVTTNNETKYNEQHYNNVSAGSEAAVLQDKADTKIDSLDVDTGTIDISKAPDPEGRGQTNLTGLKVENN